MRQDRRLIGMGRVMIYALAAAVFVTLGLSFAGALHPLGDSLAVFRLPLAGLAALLCALIWLSGLRRAALAGLALLALAEVPVIQSYLRAGAGHDFTLYQKNLYARPAERQAQIADIAAVAPDFLTLQETVPSNRHVLASLKEQLPTQLDCAEPGQSGVALASRFPAIPGSAICAQRLAALQLNTPKGAVWLVSMHLHWPWPHEQAKQLAGLLPVLRGLEGPVIVAGDFNMVPWSHTVRQVARTTGGKRAGPVRGSYDLFHFMPIAIDHVLAPGGGVNWLRGKLGSDHRGLVAHVAL